MKIKSNCGNTYTGRDFKVPPSEFDDSKYLSSRFFSGVSSHVRQLTVNKKKDYFRFVKVCLGKDSLLDV